MQKIGSSTSTATAEGEFTEGTPYGGVPATRIMAAWLNSIQRELSNAIEQSGQELDPNDDQQLARALVKNGTFENLIGLPETFPPSPHEHEWRDIKGLPGTLGISLDGPTLVYPGSTNVYKITDYSRFSVFSATTTLGTVSVSADVVTLVVPVGAAGGILDMVITRDQGEAPFRVAVGSAAIGAPTITSPMNLANGVSLDLVITASPFLVYPAGYDHQVSRRWEVALDEGFTQLVLDKTTAAGVDSIRPSDYDVFMPAGRRLYARARDIGATLQSAPGIAVAFNTATTYIRRPAITFPTDGQVNVSSSVTVLSDAFSVYGGADDHIMSRFQFALANDGTGVIQDSGWSGTNLTSYKPDSSVPNDTQIYARVKYRGRTLGETEWSPFIRFKTADKLHGVYTNLAGGATVRSSHAAAFLNGLLYIAGGMGGGNVLADLWCYNPATNSWTQKASMPDSRFGHSLTALNGKLYCFGGRRYNEPTYKPLGTLFEYDPATDKWTARSSYAPVYLHGAAGMDGRLYVYGGVTDGAGVPGSKSMYVYDPATSKWSTLPSVDGPGVRYEGSMAVLAGQLHYFAGRGLSGLNNDLWRYDLASGTWALRATKPLGRIGAAVAECNGQLYVFGGGADSSDQLNDAWMYDPQLNAWTQLPALPVGRRNAACAAVGGSFFIHGGILPPYTLTNSLLRVA